MLKLENINITFNKNTANERKAKSMDFWDQTVQENPHL